MLNEGSIAYRPVPALEIGDHVYKVKGFDIYDSEDEEWEFLPGTDVFVEEQIMGNEKILVVIQSKA
ncbi:MAG: hypothetical protein JST26_11675 [Bacteroidetes bacterium]|nr:hypothetical protein [Bacteroidota bacterium]